MKARIGKHRVSAFALFFPQKMQMKDAANGGEFWGI